MKSTPVMVKGGASVTLIFGNGGGSGALYGFPVSFLQGTHRLSKLLTHCRIEGIQNIWRDAVIVVLTPLYGVSFYECPLQSFG